MWDLYYNWNTQSLILDAYRATGADEVTTGPGSVLPGGWVKLSVQYTATSTGGARLYVNDVTQPAWMTAGNYTRAANLQILQLWNDAVGSTDFDDVRIATPPPPGATLPGAPTGVSGLARDQRGRADLARAGVGRRQPDQRLPDHAADRERRHARPDLHAVRQHELHGHRPHQRHRVHVHGGGASTAWAPVRTRAPRPRSRPRRRRCRAAPTGVTAYAAGRLASASAGPPRPTAARRSPATGSRRTSAAARSLRSRPGRRRRATLVTGLTNGTALHVHGRPRQPRSDSGAASAQTRPSRRARRCRSTRTRSSPTASSPGPSAAGTPAGHGHSSVVAGAAHTGGFGLRVATLRDAVRVRREGAQRLARGQPHELLGAPRIGHARRHGRSGAGRLVSTTCGC